MNDEQVQMIVERVLRRLESTAPVAEHAPIEGEEIPDIMDFELCAQYLVDKPHDREAFMALKAKTPARIGTGHAGARYKTATSLRFAADHAAAQAAVFSDVDDVFLEQMGWRKFSTACTSRDEFLTRPDLGRTFSQETLHEILQYAGTDSRVVLYVADGLSSSAVMANAANILPVVERGLAGHGISVSKPFFVQYGRVATMDAIGAVLNPEVVCVFLGERPGLVTAESMSAYVAYRPTEGMPESRRTVLANIHKGGTPAVEAGAHLVDLIEEIMRQKASGTDLPI